MNPNTTIASRHKAIAEQGETSWVEWAEYAELVRIETWAANEAFRAALALLPDIPQNDVARMRINALIVEIGV